ncbi:MAG: YfhO family protein [Eubacteriales bacterium]|nr:YfhO family protein [Eubacteriales bacterium]
MTEFVKKLYYNRVVRYIFFGGCTTMVNLVSYGILRYILGVDITRANFISILLSILFAYVVNKIFVFESRTEGIVSLIKEFASFVGMRLITMFIEIFGTVFLSCVWGMPDMAAKLLIQVVVLVLNFVFSKLIVFSVKKYEGEPSAAERSAASRKKRCIWISFLIPALTMFIAYIVNGVYPFGDHGVLIIDSLHQYLPFFTDFQQKLANSESLLYSFGGGLGYNMWATFAYYLASPLNFLITAVSMDHVMDFMAYLILLKIALSGAAFGWYLSERGQGKNYLPIPFACMYALSAYMIGYYFNVMWLDSVMILPLVMGGIERLTEGKSGKLFALSLFYGLYCNYYIGYMLCLFSCLYFLAIWVGVKKFAVKEFIKSGLRFAWYALLSGGMAAVVLVPAYLALGITESASNSFPSKVKFYTDGITQWTGHFALVEPINIYDDQSGVNIYCGVIILILIFLYILDKEIRFTERVSRVVLMGILLLSMNFNMLNYIWHGFHTQNGLPNRFAFLYIGLILVMGFDALRDIRKQAPWRILVGWLIPVAFTAYCFWKNVGEREWYVYAVTLLLLGLYGILLLLLRGTVRRKEAVRMVLTGAMTVEMIVTGIYGVCMNGTVGRSTYVDEQKAYQTLMPRQEGYGEFFRSEIDSQRMRNANMFMGANGVVLFSSTMPEATVKLCRSIGMEARTNKTGYNGVTKLFNDVFGIRYVMSKTAGDTLYQMEKVDYEEPLSLYRNDGALSVGFMVSSDIKAWDINDKLPMKVQDDFAVLATGVPFFYTLREAYSLEEGPTYIIRLHPGEQTYIEFTKNVESLTIKTPQYEKTISNFTTNVFNLGMVTEEGEASKANITIKYKENDQTPVPVRVYTCTDEEYQAVYEKLAANQMENVQESGNKLSGTIHADQAGTLLLTIPYDEGWSVLVNGEKTETYRVGEALTGLDLDAGDYEISMTFTPQGLWIGSILTLAAVLLFLASCYAEGRWEKKKLEEKQDEDHIFGESEYI